MTVPYDKATHAHYQEMLDEVLTLWGTGREEEAQQLGERWWAEVPDFEGTAERQASLAVAEAVAEAGRPDIARTWLARAREAYGGNNASDHARSMCGFVDGIIHFVEGDKDRAYDYFDASYQFIGKRAFHLPERQAYWDFYAKRAGIGATAESTKSRPTMNLEDLAAQGSDLLESDDPEGAIQVWEQAIGLLGANPVDHPTAMWFFASIGDAHFEMNHFQEADTALAQALIAGGTDNPFVWLRKGQSLVELGATEAGVEALTSAYMLDGDEIFEEEDPKYRQLLVDRGIITD